MKEGLLAKASEGECYDRFLEGHVDVVSDLTSQDELHFVLDVDVCWPRMERGDHWAGLWAVRDEQELGGAWERKFGLRNGGALGGQEAQVTIGCCEAVGTVAESWTLIKREERFSFVSKVSR